MEGLIEFANSIAALGVTGLLSLLFLLWLTGRLHTEGEKKDWQKNVEYLESLRVEAATDRRAADEAVKKLAEAMTESNQLTRRSLDLNERLVEEMGRRNPKRGTN